MKIVYQGDIHLRDTAPVNRIDDYCNEQWEKFSQLVAFAIEHEAPLLLGGDIFDHYKVSPETVNKASLYLKAMQVLDKGIYACIGQHDVPYHQVDVLKSPLFSLMTGAGVRASTIGIEEISRNHVLHFVSWEHKPVGPVRGKFNIFLGHVSVFKDEVPWYWKGEGYTPKTLKEKYPGYDLYLCGDIHHSLVEDNVVVSGSMMRMSIDQADEHPHCFLIDTETMEINPLYYDIKPDVFRTLETKLESTLDLESLIKAMKSSALGRESFKRDCIALAQNKHLVRKIIEEVFSEFD